MAIIIKKVKTNDAMSTFEINIRDRESGMHWIAKIKANHVREALEKCKQEVRFGWANLYINSVQEYKADNSTVGYPHLYGYLDKVILEAKNKGYDSAIKDSLIHDEDLAGYIKKLAYTDGLTTDEIFKRLYKEQPNVSAKEVQAAMFYATKNNYAQAEIKKYGFKDAAFINAKISEWDPTTLIKRMKETRNGDMHTNLIDKKGNVHTVFLSTWGTIDNAKVFVDVVVETPDGKQSRTFQKTANSWDEALKIMQDYKRQHINDSKPILDAAKAQQIVDLLKKANTTKMIKDATARVIVGHTGTMSFDEKVRKLGLNQLEIKMVDHYGWGPQSKSVFEVKGPIEQVKKLLAAYKQSSNEIKDTKINDKSFVEEIIALGREADNARWHFGGGTMDEAKIKKFITAATNSYRYIEQTFMSFMNEVKKNTDENGRWKNPTANIVSIWSNFSNEISSVKEAAYRIIDVLDDITAAASLSDSITRQAAILYKKYKDIYDRIFKSLKK